MGGHVPASFAMVKGSGEGITAVDLVLHMRTGPSPGAAILNVRPPGYHRQAIRVSTSEPPKRAEAQWLTGLSFAAPASTT